jgi:hypothetical protein
MVKVADEAIFRSQCRTRQNSHRAHGSAFCSPLSGDDRMGLKKALPLGKEVDRRLFARGRLGGKGDVAGNCSAGVD